MEDHEGRDDGHRDRHRHHHDAGDAPQEQEQDQHGQDHREIDVPGHQAHGIADVAALVIDHLQTDALVPVPLLQLVQRLPDAIHDLHGVGAGAAQHAQAQGRPAVDPHREVPVLVPERDRGHVPHVHDAPVVVPHHHVAHVAQLVELSQGPHQVPVLALAQVSALDVPVLPDDGLPDVGHGDAPGRHGPGVQRHVRLPVAAAEAPYRAHAGRPFELRHDDVLHFLPHPVEVAVRVHDDPGDGHLLVGVDRADAGLVHVRRQVGGEVELLGHPQPRHVLVGAPVELEDHRGLPLDGGGGDLPEPFDAVEVLLEAVGHLALHLQRPGATVLRLHGDLGPVHRGDHLDRKAQQGDDPEEHRQDDAHGHGDGVADTGINDAHRARPRPSIQSPLRPPSRSRDGPLRRRAAPRSPGSPPAGRAGGPLRRSP